MRKRRDAASTDTELSPAVVEDHRTRVAREKRRRMRAHLLQSVLTVCSTEESRTSLAEIDDVVRHARVARGTFYKCFKSMDEAARELSSQLADEVTRGILDVYDVLEDPLMRTATGFQTFLLRALMDPQWGEFCPATRLELRKFILCQNEGRGRTVHRFLKRRRYA